MNVKSNVYVTRCASCGEPGSSSAGCATSPDGDLARDEAVEDDVERVRKRGGPAGCARQHVGDIHRIVRGTADFKERLNDQEIAGRQHVHARKEHREVVIETFTERREQVPRARAEPEDLGRVVVVPRIVFGDPEQFRVLVDIGPGDARMTAHRHDRSVGERHQAGIPAAAAFRRSTVRVNCCRPSGCRNS
ncbi:MAG TPA: hypothetical protein VIW69_08785, partial [Candidatus Elarobacter sp.]